MVQAEVGVAQGRTQVGKAVRLQEIPHRSFVFFCCKTVVDSLNNL